MYAHKAQPCEVLLLVGRSKVDCLYFCAVLAEVVFTMSQVVDLLHNKSQKGWST